MVCVVFMLMEIRQLVSVQWLLPNSRELVFKKMIVLLSNIIEMRYQLGYMMMIQNLEMNQLVQIREQDINPVIEIST